MHEYEARRYETETANSPTSTCTWEVCELRGRRRAESWGVRAITRTYKWWSEGRQYPGAPA